MTDQDQQELIFKLSMYEQQMNQLQQQLNAIEKNIVDLKSLSLGLEEIPGSEGKEIFASIGKGIFAKAKLISEDLIVDVGGKNFVKKSVEETKKIIEDQTKKLEEVKKELNNNFENMNEEISRLFTEAQKKEANL